VHPPKPRYLPESNQRDSELERWAPRAFAIGLLIVVVFILLRLLGGL